MSLCSQSESMLPNRSHQPDVPGKLKMVTFLSFLFRVRKC